ncbi:contactin-6-like [Hemitrygon akajei]|uniref:contactin-6-like n=1 Tax=Hemitrygon akajei TaxID=2704970 RepID=UPI003BFA1A3A
MSSCADPPLLPVRQRTGSVSRSRSGTDRSGRGVDRMSVGPKNRQPRVEKFMSLLSLRIFSLVHLFSLLFQLGVVGAEAEREEVVGVLGSSVLLDPEITVDSSKNEILWTFKASNKSRDVILDHIPGVATFEPNEQFKDRLQFNALSGALTISRLNASDQGDYTFTVDGKELKIMELLVIDKVKEEVGLLGSSVLLDPELKVDPSKSEIVWTFIGRSILHHVPGHSLVELSDQFKFRLHFNTSNGALTVNGAEHGDQGDYTFIVDEEELRIIELHLFDELSEASIFTNIESLGFTVRLTCDVFGDLNVYQWRKNGGEISQHHQLTDENGTLVIPSTSIEDCGVYTCITTNPVSSIQTNYTLMLRGFFLNDVIMIAALTAGLVISAPSLHSAVLPDQWRWKTLGGRLGYRFYFLSLWVCNTLSFSAMYIVLIYWIVVEGLSPLDFVVIGVTIIGLLLSSFYINEFLYVTKIRELLKVT